MDAVIHAAHAAGAVDGPAALAPAVVAALAAGADDVEPAPRLADFDLSAEEANAMLHEVYRQVRLLLMAGRIHGDLSAFNILMCKAGPTIIEDDCFIGARSEVVEGVVVERGSVIGMGVYLGQSTRIYNRVTGEISYGRVPAGSVVVSGSGVVSGSPPTSPLPLLPPVSAPEPSSSSPSMPVHALAKVISAATANRRSATEVCSDR
jgi:hypothetical protein